MGLGIRQNTLWRTAAHQLLQDPPVAQVLGAGVQLPVGEGSGSPLSELYVGLRIQHAGAPEGLHVPLAGGGVPPPLQQNGAQAASGQHQRRKQATRPGAHHHRRHLRRRQHLRQSIPLRGEAADPPIPAAAQHLLLLPHLRRHGVHQMQLLPCVDGAAQHLHRQHVLLRDAQQPGCSPVQGRLLLLRGQFQALQLQHGGTSFTKCSKKNPFLKAYIKLSGYDNRQRNGTVLNIIAQFPAMGNIPKGGFSYVQRVS